MYNTHVTATGNELLIANMADDHLIRVIDIKARQINSARQVLQGGGAAEDPLVQIFQPQHSRAAMERRAKDQLRSVHNELINYVMEAALRGLAVTESLQTAYGRNQAIPTTGSLGFDESETAEAVKAFESGVQHITQLPRGYCDGDYIGEGESRMPY